jgi:hypothetical protein
VLPDNDPEGLDFRWIEVPAMVSNVHHTEGITLAMWHSDIRHTHRAWLGWCTVLSLCAAYIQCCALALSRDL